MDRAQLIAHLSLLGFWPCGHAGSTQYGCSITDGQRLLWLTGKAVPDAGYKVMDYRLDADDQQEISWDRLGYYFLSDFVDWLREHP